MDGTSYNLAGKSFGLAILAAGLLWVAGCTAMSFEPDVTGANYARIQVPTVADPLDSARKAFAADNFAHAARYYEMAMARQGESGEALLGVAAAYDRMWRFDLADNAYKRAEHVVGGTAEFLNNRGYSYLMRGRFEEAENHFSRAQQMVPNDPVVAGNLRLLHRLAGATHAAQSGAG